MRSHIRRATADPMLPIFILMIVVFVILTVVAVVHEKNNPEEYTDAATEKIETVVSEETDWITEDTVNG